MKRGSSIIYWVGQNDFIFSSLLKHTAMLGIPKTSDKALNVRKDSILLYTSFNFTSSKKQSSKNQSKH